MTIERPMFPPRAESVDSFFPQPRVGQPERTNLTSESRKAVGGLSRRNMLAGLAVLPAAVPASLPAIAAAPDPVVALIAAKRAVDVAHLHAIEAQDEAEIRTGFYSDATWEARDRCADACDVVNAADWKLATTPPTTLAGIAAVLRFANQIEDEGNEWPDTDTTGREGWHYQLRATMAQAIETIIRQKAVLS
jgi:hypothetical protein